MDNLHEKVNGNGKAENGHNSTRHSHYQLCHKASLSWLDIRVFYVRVAKCEINDTTPEFLTLNHVPLNRDTLLEVNGTRSSIYADNGVSTLLRRDRVDKKSEEVTFVSTDSIRATGSVKFEVLDKDVLVLLGVLDLCCGDDGFIGETENNNDCKKWSIICESDAVSGSGILKGRPEIEVYVTGCFLGDPIILTKILQLNCRKKAMKKGMLDSIPENEGQKDVSSGQVPGYPNDKPENEEYNNFYSGTEYIEGDDGELTWFNAGVRVGVGIGLSICLGIGIGVGLLVRTYQGTTQNFRRRLL